MSTCAEPFDRVMSEYDWQFVSIATKAELVEQAQLFRALVEERNQAGPDGHLRTLPQLAFERHLMTYEQIDDVLRQMFGPHERDVLAPSRLRGEFAMLQAKRRVG